MLATLVGPPRVRQLKHSGPVRIGPFVGLASAMPGLVTAGRARWETSVKLLVIPACLALSVAALSACSRPADCPGGSYRGGCLESSTYPPTEGPAAVSPAPASPGAMSPAAVSPVRPTGVSRGDPNQFADVDDKQCRSYGLTFGSRDYADCRIRLSAQHRGLDPNLGGSGSR
jgi:hypothetical protein